MTKKKTRNKFETRIESQLRRAGVSFKYESIKIPYILARHYIPDFIIDTPSGKIYLECKGYFRPEHKAKMAAVRKQHPEKDIRLLFYSKSKANEKWALKHGFKFAYWEIPQDWLEGF